MLKISVIIPTYNSGKFIGTAIKSVLSQSWDNLEIIIVDDGSSDNSRIVVESLIQIHPGKIIYHYQSNRGVSVAKNVGLKLAIGDLIAFLDADDYWLPGKLLKQISIFEQFPDVGFCCSDFLNLTPSEEKSHFNSLIDMKNFPYDHVVSNKDILKKLFKVNFLGTLTVILRKSLVDQVGLFKTELRQSEDYDFWLRCALITNFFVIKIPLGIRRIHATNLTGNYLITAQFHEQVLTDFYSKNKDFLQSNMLMPTFKDGLSDINYLIGNMKFEEGEELEAFRIHYLGLSNNLTFNNFIKFLSIVLRKCLRILTFNLISRKKLSENN